uniref:Uncharacterized protein n=1 Tax=Rhizophora mucronata TaxID=61149 RepID=A0A2P2NZW2_RHIMU
MRLKAMFQCTRLPHLYGLGKDHMYAVFPLFFAKRLSLRLEPVTTSLQ